MPAGAPVLRSSWASPPVGGVMRGIGFVGFLLLSVALAWPAAAALPTGARGRPAPSPAGAGRALPLDAARRLDANQLDLLVANDGSLPFTASGGGGLVYPRGGGRTALFTAGLRLGARVDGTTRVTVAYYGSEFGPGAMVGGAADDPLRPAYRVYKVARWTGSPADSAHVERSAAELAADPGRDPLAHHSWSEYMAGAAPYGAPWRTYRLPVTATPDAGDSVDVPGPAVRGDQMLWCVFNDADPARHTGYGGSTAPLGVEVRQTAFAWDRPGPLGSTIFLRYDLRNAGSDSLGEFHATMWGDFDIGGSHDDVAGCMPSRSLGFMYNGANEDPVYGAAAPALGFDLLAERFSPSLGRPAGMDAFVRYVDDSVEPADADQSFRAMRGLPHEGPPFVDPATGQPTPFMMGGDPVTGFGWLDAGPPPSDRRVHCSSGPWTLGPGDTLTLWVALVVGPGDSPIGSVAALRCADDYVQSLFDAGFAEPFPAPPACVPPPANCPRDADWWAGHCAPGTALPPADWLALAGRVDSLSAVFEFAGSPAAGYCAALTAPRATARDSARREYLALLSNVAAGDLGLVPTDGRPARLARATHVRIAPLTPGTMLGQVISDAPDSVRLWDAFYESPGPRALTGVDWGGPLFFGGAGTGREFLGGTLDPATMPDSFPTVELRFHRTATQRAYRFLRLERASDGGPPPQGHAYLYGGFREVGFTCWDTGAGLQLEVAFVERCLTTDDGTRLGPASQPATFDSTWGPDASADGGREVLLVLRRPYGGTPVEPGIGHDGALSDHSQPLLYALWPRLRSASSSVADGDIFRFVSGYPPTASAERLLRWLEPRPLTDGAVAAQYRAFAAGAAVVNRGLGIGAVCGDPTPVAGELIEARTQGGTVTLRWRLHLPASAARLETRTGWGAWVDVAPATIAGREVTARDDLFGSTGRRWYRLAIAAPVGVARTDSVSITAAYPDAFALVAVWPNPSLDGRPRIEFTLPVPGAARLEVYDLTGRRVSQRDLPGLDLGTHYLEIAPNARLGTGVYFVRLRFGAERRTARVVVLN